MKAHNSSVQERAYWDTILGTKDFDKLISHHRLSLGDVPRTWKNSSKLLKLTAL